MSNGIISRRNIDRLPASDLAALREGYRRMQSISDNRGYNVIAGYHGVPSNFCHTNPELFLPWHRAYVYHFEQFLRDQNQALAVPWWDWTSTISRTIGVLAAFSAATSADGSPNPLLLSRISVPNANAPINRNTRRFPRSPQELPVPRRVAELLAIPSYLEFSNRFDNGIHGFIHVWTGGSRIINGRRVSGDMSMIPFAAYDPIFFSHHAMVDRVWYLWQLRNGIDNIPIRLLSRPLPPFNLTVRDVLDIGELGYEYVVDQVTVVAGA